MRYRVLMLLVLLNLRLFRILIPVPFRAGHRTGGAGPGGTRQTFENLPVNVVIDVVEGVPQFAVRDGVHVTGGEVK